jgi:hypothetical protein
MKTYAFAPLPLLAASALAFAYYLLNIKLELYVHRLGCGCVEGFNTNSLTVIVWALLFSLLSLTSIHTSKHWNQIARWTFLAASIIAALYLSRIFMRYNYWL